jgi:hypothetical protein
MIGAERCEFRGGDFRSAQSLLFSRAMSRIRSQGRDVELGRATAEFQAPACRTDGRTNRHY